MEFSNCCNALEQEPTHAESDSDEEGDFALSLETETGLLTNPNQHAKGDGNPTTA
jgi:hypothetical protein